MTSVLVTGGAGYIGSHACKALAQAGFQPIAFDNLAYGHRWAVKWGPLVLGDILDRRALDRVFKRYKPTAVMHFAAYAYVGESVQQPLKYYRNNVVGSTELVEAMRAHGVDKMIFSSTCATYGIPNSDRLSESHAQLPINPYGFTKLVIEQLLKDCAHAHALRYVALRYFNAAGADPDVEIGEDHDPETHLIPRVLDAALSRLAQVDIYGTDYPTQDGTAIRDYIHVSDLAAAHVSSLQYLLKGGASTAINLGVGRGYSVKEVIAAAERISGHSINVREMPRRAGDPPILIADAGRANSVLNWTPHFTDIEEIMRTAWHWCTRTRPTRRSPKTPVVSRNPKVLRRAKTRVRRRK